MSHAEKFTFDQQVVAPKEAGRWLKNHNFLHQRRIDRPWVRTLAHYMKIGHFIPGSDIAFATLPDGTLHLVNGQHTLSAIVLSQLSQPLIVKTYSCENFDEIRQLYTRFDRHRRRTPLEAMNAYGLREELDLPYEAYTSMFAATGLLAGGFMPELYQSHMANRFPQFRDMEARAEIIRNWQDEAHVFVADMGRCQKYIQRFLLRAGVMSVALATYRFAPSEASDFWRNLAHDDGLKQDDPRKAVLHYSITILQKPIPMHAIARTVARAWNSFMQHESRGPIYTTRSTRPIRIDGTPHDGRSHMVYLGKIGEILHDPIPLGADPQAESGFLPDPFGVDI